MSRPANLGLRSDLLVLRGLSEIAEHPDCLVLRTPSEPDFWCGNMVIFPDGRVDPARQIARFEAEFPDARHATLAWDVAELPEAGALRQLQAMGFDIDQMDVLTLTGPLRRAPTPEGIGIRPIASRSDWAQVVALQVATGLERGHDRASYEPYVAGRFANRQSQVAEGWARWFGAFEGDRLVGDLGVFVGDGTARFQDVETHASHRGRGICAALVAVGVDWARDRDATAVPVIVADTDGAAGRVYRRCGFSQSERQVMAIRPPEDAFAG